VVLIELLNDRPDRIECVSDAVPSSVPKVDLCAILNGAAGVGGLICCCCGGSPGELGSEEVDAEAAAATGSSGTDGLGTKIVFRSLRPLTVLFRRGVAC
jgi:hypothetical protein